MSVSYGICHLLSLGVVYGMFFPFVVIVCRWWSYDIIEYVDKEVICTFAA
jgi:hypothetical protein